MIKGDTMEVNILASGSKGNSLIIKKNKTKLLVDIGISYQSLNNKLNEINISIYNIKYLLITHEHSDHIKGLKRLIIKHPNISVFLTKGTYDSLDFDIKQILINYTIIKSEDNFLIEKFNIKSFILSHDAKEPVGYVINKNNKKIVIATDTGYIDKKYFDLLKNANLYILESNHEPELLMNSRRPYYLKQRILGDTGHLSNQEAAWLINQFIQDIDKTIWAISHISEDCNTNYFIEKAIVDNLEDPTKLEIVYTSQETAGKIKLWLKLLQ